MPSFQRVIYVAIALYFSALSSTSLVVADSPAPYPLNPSSATVIDSETACNALKLTIPSRLANARYSKHSAPLQLTNVITKFYLNGDNPTTQDLYNDIPVTAFSNETDSINAIVNSAGDWDRDSVMADLGYGLEDQIQTQQGGLPSFCRFGASIITSNTSMTWFETWLPVPSNGTNYSINSSTIFSDPLAADSESGSNGGFDFKRRKLTKFSKRLLASPPSQPSSTSPPAPIITNGVASRANWRGRLVYVGSGGQRGSCSYPEMKQVLARYREATASSNLGHFGTGATTTWTIGRPEAQTDFGYRGTHVSALASQFVVRQFYGITPKKSSSNGSSGSSSKGKKKKGNKQKSKKGSKKKHHGNKRDNDDDDNDDVEKRAQTSMDQRAHFGFPTYFKGCSTGGRQAIAEAQKFPYDFDGVMAGSPAIYYNELNAYQIHVNKFQSNKSSPGYISRKLYPVIHNFILKECDTLDGLKDAVIENPAQCKPQFSRLLCAPKNLTASSSTTTSSSSSSSTLGAMRIIEQATKATTPQTSVTSTQSSQAQESQSILSVEKRATKSKKHKSSTRRHRHSSTSSPQSKSRSTSSSSSTTSSTTSSASATPTATYAPAGRCLTTDQLANLKNIYKPYTYPSGEIIHEPVLYGSETVWTVTDGVVGEAFPPAYGWFQYQVLGQSGSPDSFDYFNIVDNNFPLIRRGNQMDPGTTETSNPDLSQFFNKGGKLLHYHGLADQLIPSGSSDRFYNQVQSTVGGDLSNSYRYLHIPGMGHCRGGDGSWNFGGSGQTDDGSRPLEFSTQFDMLLALFEWVEKDKTPKKQYGAGYKITTGPEAPDYVTSTKDIQDYGNGVKFTHRFCPYPAQVVVTNNSTATQTCKVVTTPKKHKH